MKADESKDLIEKLGGLDAVQKIVNAAPEGATHFDTLDQECCEIADDTAVMLDSSLTPNLSDLRAALEHRPSPCAQCPNVGHKTCCCEVV